MCVIILVGFFAFPRKIIPIKSYHTAHVHAPWQDFVKSAKGCQLLEALHISLTMRNKHSPAVSYWVPMWLQLHPCIHHQTNIAFVLFLKKQAHNKSKQEASSTEHVIPPQRDFLLTCDLSIIDILHGYTAALCPPKKMVFVRRDGKVIAVALLIAVSCISPNDYDDRMIITTITTSFYNFPQAWTKNLVPTATCTSAILPSTSPLKIKLACVYCLFIATCRDEMRERKKITGTV